MSSTNTTDVLLKRTLRSVLVAFEAPPSVIDQFQLDLIQGDPFTWAQGFFKYRQMNDDFGLKLKILFGLTAL